MTKITQKNYEVIKIYRQKEKLFELKGKIQTLESENTKLKELLKECRECFEFLTNDNSPWCPDGADTLLVEINKVLGE